MSTPRTDIPEQFLADRGILVTRPAAQADGLCARIEAAGGRAVRFPVLTIEPLADREGMRDIMMHSDDYDLVIFVSANAVRYSLEAIAGRTWPAQLPIAAVGRATAQALRDRGLSVTFCPQTDYSSEGLLALPEFNQLRGKRILILRGAGGREHLRDQLAARGAKVSYLEVYRRVRPVSDATAILTLWQAGGIAAALVNSNESLHNLYIMIGTLGQRLLAQTPLIVPSQRTAQCAHELGLQGRVRIAQSATDADMLAALRNEFA